MSLQSEKPPSWLSRDPVIGRLLCPPISRLNLAEKSSEFLIFKAVQEGVDRRGRHVWRYSLRPGIYWWQGKECCTSSASIAATRNFGFSDRSAVHCMKMRPLKVLAISGFSFICFLATPLPSSGDPYMFFQKYAPLVFFSY